MHCAQVTERPCTFAAGGGPNQTLIFTFSAFHRRKRDNLTPHYYPNPKQEALRHLCAPTLTNSAIIKPLSCAFFFSFFFFVLWRKPSALLRCAWSLGAAAEVFIKLERSGSRRSCTVRSDDARHTVAQLVANNWESIWLCLDRGICGVWE